MFVLGEGEVIEGWEKGIMGMWYGLLLNFLALP